MACMDKRDQFAMAAMQGYLAAPDCDIAHISILGKGDFNRGLAIGCYRVADIMIEVSKETLKRPEE